MTYSAEAMSGPWKKEFPWQGKNPWDVDVAVIGGGPAGLSAAIRLRWQKTFPLVPVSVALINSGPLGGLAAMGNSILTGPSLAFPAGQLVERLQEDLQKWPLPIISNRVEAIDRERDVFVLSLEDGRKLRALSVIVATGMLDIRNLWQFWKKGVSATFGSRQNLFAVLKKELPTSKEPIIVGGPQLLSMARHLKNIEPTTKIFILTSHPQPLVEDVGLQVFQGRLLAAVEENGSFCGICVKLDGQELTLDTEKLVIDFNSLELAHSLGIQGLPRTAAGFMQSNQECCTEISGLFGAGDSIGPPFAAVVAMGQGVQAAFSCYRYVFEKKYGLQPSLFAYYGDEMVSEGPGRPDFEMSPNLVPDKLIFKAPLQEYEDLWQAINGTAAIKDLIRKSSLSEDAVVEILQRLLKERAITFCAVPTD